jgi:hypothetical protein
VDVLELGETSRWRRNWRLVAEGLVLEFGLEREGGLGREKWGHEEKAIETTVAFRHCQKDHHASGSIGRTRIEGSDEPTSPRALFSTWVILLECVS